MNLTNLKIGQRLYLGFGLVLALLVLLAGMAINGLHEAALDEARLVEMKNRAALADEWVASTRLNINRVMGLAKSGNHPEVDAHFKPLIAQTTERINVLQKSLEASIDSEQGKALLTDVGAKRKAYVDTRKTYFETLKSGDTARADEQLRTGLLPAVEAYLGAMQQLQTLEHEIVQTEVTRAQQEITRQQGITMGLAALAILIGLLIAWRVASSVIAPLREAVDVARTVARGDLARRVGSQRRDELGELLNALEEMRNALVATVSQVRQASDSIGVASSQIASGNQDLSARTEQAASNLQQTAASMEELTSTVRNSADAARQANQLASSASEVAVRGGQVVSQVVSTMQEIHHSSQKINDIIGVIDGIAFQTNILALNAAVEAARAGEQGRGFAVVAGEVRNLAQRSAEAAKEIKGLIGASVERVDVGTKLVADAGQTMSEIVGSIQRVTDIVGEITAAAGEQSDGIGQVNVAVNQLDQMTQQNAALVEESAAAAQSLKDQAQRLAQVVAVFRLDANASAPAHATVHNPAVQPLRLPLQATAVRRSPAAAPKAAASLPKPATAPKAAAPVAPAAPAKPAPVPASAEGDWESF